MTRHVEIVPNAAPLIDPRQVDEALLDLMPMMDWLSQADILHQAGLHKQSANAMVEVLLAYQALPKRSPAHAAFTVYISRNAMRVEPQPRSLRRPHPEIAP
jgi:hypothetical protein